MTLTKDHLSTLMELSEKATPGPLVHSDGSMDEPNSELPPWEVYIPLKGAVAYCRKEEDAAFFAASRQALPLLVNRVLELEEDAAWRPIETAPRDGTVLLACVKQDGTQLVGEAHWVEETSADCAAWWWAQQDPGDPHSEPIQMMWVITHWRPLPAPPALEKQA